MTPHPTRDALPLTHEDVDPSTVYVFIAGARRGRNDALPEGLPRPGQPKVEQAVLYVGVVAQSISTRWRGLAGMYVPLCDCAESAGWKPARRLLTGLEGVDVTADVLPAGLRPRPDWWDHRLVATRRIGPRSAEWVVRDLAALMRRDQPVLIRTSPRLSDDANLLLARTGDDLAAVARLLPDRVPSRTGLLSMLTRSIGAETSDAPPAGVLTARSRRAPTGWCIVEGGGRRELTRDAMTLVRQAGLSRATVLQAPRLGTAGVVDAAALVNLLHRS